MRTRDNLNTICSDNEKFRTAYATASQYDRLQLVAYRLKDVKVLFPKKRAMAETFVKNIKFQSS
ncbi:hypothetical protein SAMN05661012_05774 [Chitinophaga sancti]|uniref:Uncharacterized protein n=1 Tax=Chitinophaga sancti TaxID=1004 RepID=A0A1K1SPD0_9BACT|nr:hypothetical protein SAMN05661012_05774 [Chitinophaga sancti]